MIRDSADERGSSPFLRWPGAHATTVPLHRRRGWTAALVLSRALVRVTVIGAGTRGDVQPAAVVAAELQQRGHDVVFAASDDLLHLGTSLRLESVPLGLDVRGFLASEEGADFLARGDARSYLRGLLRYKSRHSSLLRTATLRATDHADLIVTSNLMAEEAAAVAEFRGVPMVGLHYAPRRRNSAYPPIGMAPRARSPLATSAAHRYVELLEWRATSASVNEFRQRLGLPMVRRPIAARMRRAGALEPQLYSEHLVPRLADWSPRRPLLGFVTPTAAQRRAWGEGGSDPGLHAWLAKGDPPIYFGFGSMPVADPASMLALVRRVSRRLGARALVGAGWTDYGPSGSPFSSEDLRVVRDIDHGSVLPHCVAAVHHGGAGTTAASVMAGLPTAVCAVAFDQPFWGERLVDAGIGTWMPFRSITEDTLQQLISPLLDRGMAAGAHRVGAQLREERAAEELARRIEEASPRRAGDRTSVEPPKRRRAAPRTLGRRRGEASG